MKTTTNVYEFKIKEIFRVIYLELFFGLIKGLFFAQRHTRKPDKCEQSALLKVVPSRKIRNVQLVTFKMIPLLGKLIKYRPEGKNYMFSN